MNLYEVNIGDGDILRLRANTLNGVEGKIRKEGEFAPWMINSVKVIERGPCPCEVCKSYRRQKSE